MSAASTFSHSCGHSSFSHPCSVMSGWTPGGTCRLAKWTCPTLAPALAMISPTTFSSSWVWLSLGSRFRVVLKTSARSAE